MTAALAAAVILCGGVAAVARYLVAVWFSGDTRFPWAVLIVNAVGSALGGAVLGFGTGFSDDVRLVLLTGVAGGLTTFSTLSVETLQLILDGRARVAALNIGANLAAGLGAAGAAFWLVTW
ncbi:MAG: CrcB family protein [Homoserinimonas sp.]